MVAKMYTVRKMPESVKRRVGDVFKGRRVGGSTIGYWVLDIGYWLLITVSTLMLISNIQYPISNVCTLQSKF